MKYKPIKISKKERRMAEEMMLREDLAYMRGRHAGIIIGLAMSAAVGVLLMVSSQLQMC